MCFEEQLITADLSEFSESLDVDEYLHRSSYLLSSYLVDLLGTEKSFQGVFLFQFLATFDLTLKPFLVSNFQHKFTIRC